MTLITYMFLHANFWHIFGNMIFLWVFGDDIEEALGHWRFLAFYLSCGVGAGIAFVLSDLHSNMELIGASGAVAGVIAAYLLFRPCAKVTVLVGLLVVRVRAFWVIRQLAILAGSRGARPKPRMKLPVRRMWEAWRQVPCCSSWSAAGRRIVRMCATRGGVRRRPGAATLTGRAVAAGCRTAALAGSKAAPGGLT